MVRGVELVGGVEIERIGLLAEGDGMLAAVRLATDHQPLQSVFALAPDQVAGQRDRLENPPALLVGHQVAPVFPARVPMPAR